MAVTQDITKLTPTQTEVINLLAAGLDAPEIAHYLSIDKNTVKNHVYDAKQRLDPDHWVSRGRLVALYVAHYGLPNYHPIFKD